MKRALLAGLAAALLFGTAFQAQAQKNAPAGYEGRRIGVKADLQTYHYGLMPGVQVEYLLLPRFAVALSANQRSFSKPLVLSEYSDYINSSLGETDFKVLNTSLFLRFYEGDKFSGVQVGKYNTLQFGINRISATVPLEPVVYDRFGYFISTNKEASETYETSGYTFGYGKGHQYLLAKRLVLDFSTIAFVSLDKGFDVGEDLQSQALSTAVQNILYDPFGIREDTYAVNEAKLSFNVRLGLRIGYLF